MRRLPTARPILLSLTALALLACGEREPPAAGPRDAVLRVVQGVNESDPEAILRHVDSDFRGGREGREPDLDYAAAQAVALELAMRERPLVADLVELRVIEDGPERSRILARVRLGEERSPYRFDVRLRRREGTWQVASLTYEPL